MARGLSRGEVVLVRFPPPDKERPAVVLTRDSALRVLHRITVAPITSTLRGIPTEVVLGPDDGMKAECAVNLDNVITIHQRLVGRSVATLSQDKLARICSALAFALGCEGGG